ncbi:hypothetical protein NC981_21575 [Leptolyngbya sp. DQ-M1]|uniref:hypothetical protein n=1 Tax=Leptolyngbya sp. DQ-M1 TaxID=2933920 RepID=UPI003299FBC1
MSEINEVSYLHELASHIGEDALSLARYVLDLNNGDPRKSSEVIKAQLKLLTNAYEARSELLTYLNYGIKNQVPPFNSDTPDIAAYTAEMLSKYGNDLLAVLEAVRSEMEMLDHQISKLIKAKGWIERSLVPLDREDDPEEWEEICTEDTEA